MRAPGNRSGLLATECAMDDMGREEERDPIVEFVSGND